MLVAFIRTIIIYFLLILSMRIMGKRQLGDLQPGELAITIIISDLASIPITDTGIPLIYGLIPLFTLVVCELLISSINLKKPGIRHALLGSPKVVIVNGSVQQKELKALRITLDDLLAEVRNNGCVSFAEVGFAIIETDGKVSVIPKSPTSRAPKELPRMIISDGLLIENEVVAAGLSLDDVKNEIKKHKLSINKIFYCFYDNGEYEFVRKERI